MPSYFIVMAAALFKVRLLSDALGNKITVSYRRGSRGLVVAHKKQKSRQPNGECLILEGLNFRLMP